MSLPRLIPTSLTPLPQQVTSPAAARPIAVSSPLPLHHSYLSAIAHLHSQAPRPPFHRYKKEPRLFFRKGGANTWRRPTLTRPIVSLPSALQRFTSGFGMGPGGSTALWSPEGNPVPSGLNLWGSKLCLSLMTDCRWSRGRTLLLHYQLSATNHQLTLPASPLADIHTEKSSFNTDGQSIVPKAIHGLFSFLIPKTGIKPNG